MTVLELELIELLSRGKLCARISSITMVGQVGNKPKMLPKMGGTRMAKGDASLSHSHPPFAPLIFPLVTLVTASVTGRAEQQCMVLRAVVAIVTGGSLLQG